MAPRAFDRYMVSIGMGTHPKLAALTDAEFRAHVVGVLAVAAMAPVRGRLLVGSLPAEPIHIARAAGVTEKAAASALRKLTSIGVLTPDPEHDCLRVHDWDDVNPSPGAARTRRWRDGKRDDETSPERHGERHASVTRGVTETSPEVKKVEGEGEEERNVNNDAELRSAVVEVFAYWRERCGHSQAHPSDDRLSKIKARIVERRRFHKGDLATAVRDCRQAVDGAAVAPFVDDRGKRHDGIQLIFRNNEKLEDFMGRAARSNVTPLRQRDYSHLPEGMRPSPEWVAQMEAHCAAMEGESA